MRRLSVKLSNLAWSIPVLRRWTAILHIHHEYGWSIREVNAMWHDARRQFVPGRESFIGTPRTIESDLYYAAARRSDDESTDYRCAEGCCVVIWHPTRGMTGGYGPAGCPCDDMDDPRGPNPVLIGSAA